MLNKDATLLAEWKVLATAAERGTFVEALKELVKWDDIVIKGKKGIIEVLSAQYKNVDEFLLSSEYANKVASDFVKYQAKGGLANVAKYTNKHKIITGNRMRGKIAESVFQDLEKGIKPDVGIQTSDGVRYIDNLLNGTARELKSGKIANTTDFQRQVKKDIEIISKSLSSDVSKIEWHALDGIENDALKFIKNEMTKQNVSANSFKVVVY